MKFIYLIILCLSVVASACSHKVKPDPRIVRADEANERNLKNLTKEQDSIFVINATESGIMEVESGRLALQKTANPDVKTFAQRMVDEHTNSNNDLKKLAEEKKLTLPVYLNIDDQNKLKELSARIGNDFDKAYIDLMVLEHVKDMDQFKMAGEQLEDNDLKNFARANSFTLASHLDMAKRIQDKISH